MGIGKDDYLKVIVVIKETGFCPACYTIKNCSKSGSTSYFCSGCKRTFVFEKDYMIMSWYGLDHGRRVLKSYKIHTSDLQWKGILALARISRKKRGRRKD